MSIESVSRVLPIQGLPPAQKLCLIGIANHDGDGGAWPSMETLAMYVGVSVRQAQRLVAILENAGYISVEKNAGGNAKTRKDRRPNLYRLHLDEVTPTTPRDERGDIQRADGVTSSAERGDIAVSPEPSLTIKEPSLPQLAQVLAVEWWENRAEKPNQSFIAAKKVIQQTLNAGWSDVRLRDALKDIPVVSGGALDLWASKHPLPPPPKWTPKHLMNDLIEWAMYFPDCDRWLLHNEARVFDSMDQLHWENKRDDEILAIWKGVMMNEAAGE